MACAMRADGQMQRGAEDQLMAQLGNVVPFTAAGQRPPQVGASAPAGNLGELAAGLQQGQPTGVSPTAMMQGLEETRSPFARPPIGDTPDQDGQDIEPPELSDLRRQYQDYVQLKAKEIEEAREALQYYHGRQFTQEQIDKMEARGQPAIVFNRIGRKINGLVGVLAKLRGDPKCFGRNSPDEHGAELATQCIRYALDACQWTSQESEALRVGACTGIVAAEMSLTTGDKGDPDVEIAAVDVTTFFYDPRSLRLNFSDARYLGVAKMVTRDEFEEVFPGRWDEAFSNANSDSQTQFDWDKEYLWSQGRTKLRLVEHWYRSDNEWRYAFYAGAVVLQYGTSPFFDEKGKTVSRYDAFAVFIDELGDHYGFVRSFKGPQDAINQHRSKAIWIMNTRQLKIARSALGGDGQDVERKRTEAARADGVLVWESDPDEIQIIQNDSEFLKQTQYFQDARQELDSFGPNMALAGGPMPQDTSGRSLAMQQQAGLAEMGPFIDQWNHWKLKLYRKIWIQQQRNWTAERTLRVTKDMQTAQYITVNQSKIDQWGRPILANVLGALDVEVLVDEGPNTVNVMADAFDTLSAMAQKGIDVPPPVIIELSGLPRSIKDKVQQLMGQPDPAKQALLQATVQNKQADSSQKQAAAQNQQASAVHKLALAHHEVNKAHQTGVDTAATHLDALQPQPPPDATQPPQAPPFGPPPGGLPGAPPNPGSPGGPLPPTPGPPGAPGQMPPLPPQGLAQLQALAGPQAGGVPPGALPGPPLPQASGPSVMQLGAASPLPASQPMGRPLPGGPPVRAPDGHFYVHHPHAGGLYHRVRLNR